MANGRLGVTRDTRQAASEIQDVLAERDPTALGAVAVSTTGGVIAAQEIADRVLPALGMNREPQNATEFAASAGVKGATAAGIGVLATRLTGLPLVVTAFAGIGALASTGADLVNAVQRTGFLAEAPFQGSAVQSSPARASPASQQGSSSGQAQPQATPASASGGAASVSV